MTAGPGAYAAVSAVLLGIGLFGVLSRRDTFGVVLSLSLLLLAPVLALVGFAHLGSGAVAPVGDALALFAVVAAAACAAFGSGTALLAARRLGTTHIEPLTGADD